ncbi:hypothetical protein My1_044 [Pectobacterium phage My1]|uniref:Uncharacterized protein n=1 Tax=Pectobacterium phage My1 TaxID=1204539 RepID=J9QM61_9CAUD|nr:hypothetical protein My1_044 [Pectobacterium phage My1]AFQ22203.1 hypothetical protein My1_044 [Pectobacterium phage My1]
MQIISKFQDVYDLQHSLFDESRRWVRNSETVTMGIPLNACIALRSRDVYANIGRNGITSKGSYTLMPVFICGVVHWVHSISVIGQEQFYTTNPALAEKFLLDSGVFIRDFRKREILKSISLNGETTRELEKLCKTLEAPIVMLSSVKEAEHGYTLIGEFIKCPSLIGNNIPWQEIEPNLYRLHQSIESYVFGVLSQPEPIVLSTTEKDRLQARGFDSKASFRKAK